MTEWVKTSGERVVVIFRRPRRSWQRRRHQADRRASESPDRTCRGLPVPSERQETQWYFQRYVEHLPAGGEIVLFDRSWYNRAGIEKVLGFCTAEEHRMFLQQCPMSSSDCSSPTGSI